VSGRKYNFVGLGMYKEWTKIEFFCLRMYREWREIKLGCFSDIQKIEGKRILLF
jgi:hypothetical protein